MARCKPRLPEDLHTQIIAKPREKCLVQQQPAELTAVKTRAQEPFFHLLHRQRHIQHIRPDALQKRVRRHAVGIQHLDFRGAVKQHRGVFGFKPHAQASRRLRRFPRFHHAPDAIQLIVAVERQST